MTGDLTTFKTGAVITAGGVSRRFGSNKLLCEIELNKTVIQASVEKFLDLVDIICVPCHSDVRRNIEERFKTKKIIFAEAGRTRQESVFHGLTKLQNHGLQNVLIHDGARPFIDEDTIKKVIEKLKTEKGVCVGVWATDTIKITDDKGRILRTIDRNTVFQAQTPQGFRFREIYEAHKILDGENYTDDSSMFEYLKIPVLALEGNRSNKKITFQNDVK